MRCITAASALLALVFAGSTAPSVAAEQGDRAISGVWWTDAYRPRLLPMSGDGLPLTAEGRARYAKTAAGLKSGATVDEAVHACVPEGMPRAMTSAYPFQIMVTPGQIVFFYEANRAYRTIRYADQHADPKIWDPAYMGEPIAKWSGDTLVIDSNNFKSDSIYLDASGLPTSDQLHLIEHIRLIRGGKELEDLVTVNDPVIFSKPWTARLTFQRRPDVQVRTDWVCGEPHRDVSAVMHGADK